GLDAVDLGDVDPVQLDAAASFTRITAAAREARRLARLPLFVGGDHSVSLPLVAAFDDEADLHVVQFDAHLDYRHARHRTARSNPSPCRRAFDALPGLAGRTVVGLRGLRADEEAVVASRGAGHDLIHADEVHDSLSAVLARLPQGR